MCFVGYDDAIGFVSCEYTFCVSLLSYHCVHFSTARRENVEVQLSKIVEDNNSMKLAATVYLGQRSSSVNNRVCQFER